MVDGWLYGSGRDIRHRRNEIRVATHARPTDADRAIPKSSSRLPKK